MPFAIVTMSGSTPKCSIANILPGAAHARLHFVDDEQHAVLRRELAQPLEERCRRHDVAALALNRLDDDRRDLVGRDQVHQDLLLDERERRFGARVGAARSDSDTQSGYGA